MRTLFDESLDVVKRESRNAADPTHYQGHVLRETCKHTKKKRTRDLHRDIHNELYLYKQYKNLPHTHSSEGVVCESVDDTEPSNVTPSIEMQQSACAEPIKDSAHSPESGVV